MADWFKFYNDGLDSKGMQFAIGEQPLVTSVWLVILSEASKNRSKSIKWSDEDFELIGYARKLNVSVPVFNQSINLLRRIGYILTDGKLLTIPGWEAMQSDYSRGLDKGYYKKTSKLLASNSEVSTVRREEKRREESRKEVVRVPHKNSTLVSAAPPHRPTLAMMKLLAAKIGLPDDEAEACFNHYESNGWKVGKNQMKSWTHAMSNWKKNWQSGTYSSRQDRKSESKILI